MRQSSIAADGETWSRGGSNIALELGSGRSQDTSTSLAIGQASIGVNAIGAFWEAGLTNTILTIIQLLDLATRTTMGGQMEAARLAPRDEGIRTSNEESSGNEALHDDRDWRERESSMRMSR